jgi:hypothetical protein
MPAAFSCRALYMGLNAESSDRILNDVIEEGPNSQQRFRSVGNRVSQSIAATLLIKWVNWLFHHARIRLLSLQHIR